MNILINKLTDLVEGIDSPSTPFNYLVELDDSLNPTKVIEEQEGEIQKTNEQGQPLYRYEVYRTETREVLVGRDEVLEDTGVPVMIKAQKTDEDGFKLYLEPLYEDGEIVDYAEVVHAFDEDGTPNEPIIVDVQKTSIGGKPLFYKDIIEAVTEEILDHVEEIAIADYSDIELLNEEVSLEDSIVLDPVMIPNMIKRTYDLKSNPELFTGQDILQAKYQHVLDESQKDYIIGDMFIDEQDLDLEDEKHSANTGFALLQLLPNGQAKTKSIELAEPTTEFKLLDFNADDGIDIYLSGKKFVNGVLTLASPISNCTIKFVNTTDRPKIVKSYAIGY